MWKNGDATIRFGTGEGPFAAPEPEPDVPTPETPVTPVGNQKANTTAMEKKNNTTSY